MMFLSIIIAKQRSHTTTVAVTGPITLSNAYLVFLSILSALLQNSENPSDLKEHLLKEPHCNFCVTSLGRRNTFIFNHFKAFQYFYVWSFLLAQVIPRVLLLIHGIPHRPAIFVLKNEGLEKWEILMSQIISYFQTFIFPNEKFWSLRNLMH